MLGHVAGQVVVAAGDGERMDAVISALLAEDALVAVVASRSTVTAASAWFRVDPTDADVWQRVIPHVEQRLGPIDAAVTTGDVHAFVRELLEPDMRRRGHGSVIDIDAVEDAAEVLRLMQRTQR